MPERSSWIPLADGVRLAASLFIPDGEGPWPVVIEALPYRKDDQTQSYWPEYRRLRDEAGYAVARIDVESLPPKGPGMLRWFLPPKVLRNLKR